MIIIIIMNPSRSDSDSEQEITYDLSKPKPRRTKVPKQEFSRYSDEEDEASSVHLDSRE